MNTGTIDYDALAKQYGATSSQPAVDYDALAKQYGATSSQPAQPKAEEGHAGFWHALGSDIMDMAKSAPDLLPPVQVYHQFRHAVDNYKSVQATGKTLETRAGDQREAAGYSPLYSRVAAPLAQGIGVNASGMEQSAAQGDVGGVMGHAAAVPAVMAATEGLSRGAGAVARAGKPLAEKMYQSALKPSTTIPAADVKSMVNTGLENNIPVSAAGAQKLDGLIGNLRDAVKATIASDPAATINKYKVASRLTDTAKQFSRQVTPGQDLEAISNTGNEFLGNQPAKIPATEAQGLKTGTYNQLRKKYGEMKGSEIEAQKALARGIKEELEQQFPEIKGMNAQESQFIGLDKALDHALNRIGNRNLLSLGGRLTAAAGGSALAAMRGNAAEGVATGAALAVMNEVLTNPMVQSRLAMAINVATKGRLPAAGASGRIMAYANALSQASNANTPSGMPSQK